MKIPVITQIQIAAGVVVVGAVVYAVWRMKKGVNENAEDWASKIAKAIAGALGSDIKKLHDIPSGAVKGVGDYLGVPRTSVMLCTQAQAKGDRLAVSQYCTAAEYIAWQAGQIGADLKDLWNDLFDSGKVDFIGGGGQFGGYGATGSW